MNKVRFKIEGNMQKIWRYVIGRDIGERTIYNIDELGACYAVTLGSSI